MADETYWEGLKRKLPGSLLTAGLNLSPLSTLLSGVKTLGDVASLPEVAGYRAPTWATPQGVTNWVGDKVGQGVSYVGGMVDKGLRALGYTGGSGSRKLTKEEIEALITGPTDAYSKPIADYEQRTGRSHLEPGGGFDSLSMPIGGNSFGKFGGGGSPILSNNPEAGKVPNIDNNDILGRFMPAITRALEKVDTHDSRKSTEMMLNPNYYTVGAIGNKRIQQWIPVETESAHAVNNNGAQGGAALASLAAHLLGNRTELEKEAMMNASNERRAIIETGPGNRGQALNEKAFQLWEENQRRNGVRAKKPLGIFDNLDNQ